MTQDRPVLYSFRRCPYAMRARLAIAASDVTVHLREVVLADKPDDMIAASPKATVPVLVLEDGRVIDESLDIMRWSLARNDPEAWLEDAAGSASLIERNDGPFKFHLDRYKYPDRYDDAGAETHRAAGLDILADWNDRLSRSANLLGDAARLADHALVPFVRQFANTDRAWFDAAPLPCLQAWLDRHLRNARFDLVMAKYPAWKTTGRQVPFPPADASS